MIEISAFSGVPQQIRGLVRDLRVRWALEEAGLSYVARLLPLGDQKKPEYRALQPFGQVPIFQEDGLVLFESGAIVLYIGERCESLLPRETGARARAVQWVVASLNSIEPFVMNFAMLDADNPARAGAEEFLRRRLAELSESLGDKPYLDGQRFTAGDLLMSTVLCILRGTNIVSSDPRLSAYVQRCTARPGYLRALDAQMGDFH
jgi:glutathione S-transferase